MKRHLRVLIFAWAAVAVLLLTSACSKGGGSTPTTPPEPAKSLTFPQAASMPTGASTPGARHPGLDGQSSTSSMDSKKMIQRIIQRLK